MLIAFNKPFGVLSQFTADGSSHRTLADFGFPENVYALGRLDADSEGLLLLSDEAALNKELLMPMNAHARIYWVQVENVPTQDALQKLERGLRISDYQTKPCRAGILQPQPQIEARTPPVRVRKSIPDCWIELELTEGKNRQVRRMTAAVGHPTLRLIRVSIGEFSLNNLSIGQWKELDKNERKLVLAMRP